MHTLDATHAHCMLRSTIRCLGVRWFKRGSIGSNGFESISNPEGETQKACQNAETSLSRAWGWQDEHEIYAAVGQSHESAKED